MRAVIGSTYVRFDKGGENFYDQISALHKSVRGSDPDAALYWLCRMLAGGCDPMYVARRALRMASEDIGNADPRALTMALEACAVYERLGSPEANLAIAQAVVFMACAAKSNAVYTRRTTPPQRMPRSWGRSSPVAPAQRTDTPHEGDRLRQRLSLCARRAGRLCGRRALFSGRMPDRRYYVPVTRGLEIKIGEALDARRARDSKLQDAGKS
jgi:putative ATPase